MKLDAAPPARHDGHPAADGGVWLNGDILACACPDCGAPIQRIAYADNEINYCARCQTGGKILADRALSRLLKKDWPRSLDEWEQRLGHVEE